MLQVVTQLPWLDFTTLRQIDVMESLLEGAPLEFDFVDHCPLYFFARLHLEMLEVQLMAVVVAFEVILELRVQAGVVPEVKA